MFDPIIRKPCQKSKRESLPATRRRYGMTSAGISGTGIGHTHCEVMDMLQTFVQWKSMVWKAALCVLLAIGVCLALWNLPVRQAAAMGPPLEIATAEGVLRLHVIANSDSPADQAVKLRVRDAILRCMEPGESIRDAETFVMEHGDTLLLAAERTLRENGFSYSAQLMLGTFDFPDRTYGGTLYPAGEYEALRVVLGRGAGQNWWCVLFPPLCIVTEETESLPSLDELSFKSSIVEWLRSLGVVV